MNYDDDDKIDDNDDNDDDDDDDDDDNNDGNGVFWFINFFVRIQYLKLHYSDQRWFQPSVSLFHGMEKVGMLILKLVPNLSIISKYQKNDKSYEIKTLTKLYQKMVQKLQQCKAGVAERWIQQKEKK